MIADIAPAPLRDNMTPVEPKVANQLEAGYRELRPWSEVSGRPMFPALRFSRGRMSQRAMDGNGSNP